MLIMFDNKQNLISKNEIKVNWFSVFGVIGSKSVLNRSPHGIILEEFKSCYSRFALCIPWCEYMYLYSTLMKYSYIRFCLLICVYFAFRLIPTGSIPCRIRFVFAVDFGWLVRRSQSCHDCSISSQSKLNSFCVSDLLALRLVHFLAFPLHSKLIVWPFTHRN